MKIKKIKWEEADYGSLTGSIDGARIFTVFYDSVTPKDKVKDNKFFIVSNKLPGYKSRISVESREKGKEVAEILITRFIERMTE